MPILIDKIFQEVADQAYEAARLGRNGVLTPHDQVLAEVLVELEATGDAMRFLDGEGPIAWKATSQLRDYLMDLQLDAEADLKLIRDRPISPVSAEERGPCATKTTPLGLKGVVCIENYART